MNCNDLLNLVAYEFSQKYAAFCSKSRSDMQRFSGLTALFLLKDQTDTANSDDIALMGHRIGVADDLKLFKDYLNDLWEMLRPGDQAILVAIHDIGTVNNLLPIQENMKNAEHQLLKSDIGFAHGAMFGPYFGLFKIGMAALRNIAMELDWHFDVLHEQGDGSYIVSLYSQSE